MKKLHLVFAALMVMPILAGCETAKSTLSGPFIGMEKDAHNFAHVGKKAYSGLLNDGVKEPEKKGVIYRVDDWMQKHMW